MFSLHSLLLVRAAARTSVPHIIIFFPKRKRGCGVFVGGEEAGVFLSLSTLTFLHREGVATPVVTRTITPSSCFRHEDSLRRRRERSEREGRRKAHTVAHSLRSFFLPILHLPFIYTVYKYVQFPPFFPRPPTPSCTCKSSSQTAKNISSRGAFSWPR